jgi:hypothetical protein
VVGRLFDRVPVDSVSVAKISVLDDGNCSSIDLVQRPQTQRLERGFDNVQRREHLGQRPTTNVLQISANLVQNC